MPGGRGIAVDEPKGARHLTNERGETQMAKKGGKKKGGKKR